MLTSARPAWGHLIPEVGLPLFGLFIYSIVVSLLIRGEFGTAIVSLPDLPLSQMGAALGIFLGFRTNSAYGRWWEARTLWGQLVNQSRSLARQAIAFAGTHPDRAAAENWVRVLLHTHIAYVHSLRTHLRREDVLAAVRPLLSEEEWQPLQATANIPACLLRRLGSLVAEGAGQKYLDGFQEQRMDQTLSAITDVQGGCERIKNTPLPRQYDLFPEFFTFVYCALLPLGLVGRMGLATAPLVVLIAFVFLATNRIGRNIENPFERLPNDVPMTALTATIETDLRQALNEPIYPAPVQAVHGVLM